MEDKHLQTPQNIDDYIESGIQKGKCYKKRKQRSIISLLSSIAVIFLFVTSIKVSPAFANTVKSIPGMEAIVKMIEGDQGLEDAIKNEFIHEVDVKSKHDDVVFTVERMIVDQARILLFYSIEASNRYNFPHLKDVMFHDENGEDLEVSFSYSDPNESVDFQKEEKMNGKISINLHDENVPSTLLVSAKIVNTEEHFDTPDKGEVLAGTWNLEIPIQKEWYENTREIIQLDKKVSMKEQTIHLNKVVIDPTLIGLDVQFDKNNSNQLFAFEDLRIVNENGEIWDRIQNGIVSTGSENHFTLFFQSNYFTKPEELYLVGSMIRSLNKEEREVVVDVKEEKLLQAPDDGRLQLKEINKEQNNIQLVFHVEKAEPDQMISELFDHIPTNMDEDTEVSIGFSSLDGTKNFEYLYTIHNPKIRDKIVLKITDYPNRIKDPFKIRIK